MSDAKTFILLRRHAVLGTRRQLSRYAGRGRPVFDATAPHQKCPNIDSIENLTDCLKMPGVILPRTGYW